MRTNRRNFLNIAALAGATASFFPLSACSSKKEATKYPDYTALDEAMRKPVLKKKLTLKNTLKPIRLFIIQYYNSVETRFCKSLRWLEILPHKLIEEV